MGIAAIFENSNLLNQFHGGMLSPGQILCQAHEEEVFLRSFDNNSGYFLLAQGDIGVQTPLAADQQVTSIAVLSFHLGHRDRFLEAKLGNVSDDLCKLPL